MYSIAKTWVVDEYPHIVQPPICSSLYALLLTQAMCMVTFLYSSIASLSGRSVPTHYTAAKMLFALCSTSYSSNVYGDIPVQYSQLELEISTDTFCSCQHALHCSSVPLCYFTLPYRTWAILCLKWLYTIDIGSPCHLCFAVLSLLYFTVPNLYSVKSSLLLCCKRVLF